ncbi:MAG: hypothetical protein L0H96_04695 [Humibacillus sp.]|nr:hypothetical protein [Humibacillus sp.]MDN5776187.1 hypothetical protein [Humibacillus sp.]
MATTVNATYATPHSKNAWAYTADAGAYRKIKGISEDGVTNTFLLLALARANSRSATVVYEAGTNQITAVYL